MRGALPDDLRLIAHAWVQEMRHAPFAAGCNDDVFFPGHRKLVFGLVRRAWTLVACNPEDAQHVFGFAVFELAPARLHWLYVKGIYQRLGLGTALLEGAFGERLGQGPIRCSHASKIVRLRPDLLERHRLVYDPYLLMKDTPDAPADSAPDSSERPVTFDGPDSPGP